MLYFGALGPDKTCSPRLAVLNYADYFKMLPQWAVVILATVAMATPLSIPSATESIKRNVPGTHVLHERHQPSLQSKWVKRAKIDKGMVLPVRIGLRQSNLDEGHSRLMDMCVGIFL